MDREEMGAEDRTLSTIRCRGLRVEEEHSLVAMEQEENSRVSLM